MALCNLFSKFVWRVYRNNCIYSQTQHKQKACKYTTGKVDHTLHSMLLSWVLGAECELRGCNSICGHQLQHMHISISQGLRVKKDPNNSSCMEINSFNTPYSQQQ